MMLAALAGAGILGYIMLKKNAVHPAVAAAMQQQAAAPDQSAQFAALTAQQDAAFLPTLAPASS